MLAGDDCLVRHPRRGTYCTLRRDHGGPRHRAHGPNGRIVDSWPVSDADEFPDARIVTEWEDGTP